jgi:hypothetical protein
MHCVSWIVNLRQVGLDCLRPLYEIKAIDNTIVYTLKYEIKSKDLFNN